MTSATSASGGGNRRRGWKCCHGTQHVSFTTNNCAESQSDHAYVDCQSATLKYQSSISQSDSRDNMGLHVHSTLSARCTKAWIGWNMHDKLGPYSRTDGLGIVSDQ